MDLTGQALNNYNNFRNSKCVGGDPAYLPLLEWLRTRHSETGIQPDVYAQIPILEKQRIEKQNHFLFRAILRNIVAGATGIQNPMLFDLLANKETKLLRTLQAGHGRRLYSHLNLQSLNDSEWQNPVTLFRLYRRIKQYCKSLSPRIRDLDLVLSGFDRKLKFYRYARPGPHALRYQSFPCAPLDILIQPYIDCCLFNGHSRHRAATVAFLTHPAVRLMCLYDTRDQQAVGATIEADMLDEQRRLVRVLDSVEIGDYRNQLSVHYGWISLTMRGVIRRCRETCPRNTTVFINTGFDQEADRGYLSHVSAHELAKWLKERFPVAVIPLKLKHGLEPLRAKGAVDPRINLEIISTKKRNDMFNLGIGSGVGVRIDPWNPNHLKKIGLDPQSHVRSTAGTR